MAENYDWQIRHYRSMLAAPAAAVQTLEKCQGLETGSDEAIASATTATVRYSRNGSEARLNCAEIIGEKGRQVDCSVGIDE